MQYSQDDLWQVTHNSFLNKLRGANNTATFIYMLYII